MTSPAKIFRIHAKPVRRFGGWRVLVMLALSATTASAQMSLYERLPAGFAFVRFASALPGDVIVKPESITEPMTLTTEGAGRISAYYGVEDVVDRTFFVELGGKARTSFALTPGVFQTVLLERSGGGLAARVVIDQAELSQNKARLAFYNAVPDCAGANLQIEPDGQAIFLNVGPNLMRGRSVNPAPNARVIASCGSAQMVALNLGPLDAGGQYSVWLMAPEGAPIAFISKNTIAPYLR
ncbi:ABC transporter permease [Methylocystis heyeri]|uniref:ABC transporter permease n=1 Tax=Methylocystis heyeri TaxID=391905 RepID=A0A6B8KG51_9HYPH|nr:ABC transporter permease [Methylocystis heyeri]QGM45463.1 ABC transporter permease [Methylocystis heyeri]